MSAATTLTISNLALNQIGAKELTTFGETTTKEGRVINSVYTLLLDEILEEHPWSFAQKRVALVDMTEPEDYSDWVTATDYEVDDIVYDPTLTKYYKCLVAHTSTTLFATDLASVYWELYTDWATSTVYDVGDNVYNSGVSYACLVNHSSGTFATDLTALKWVATEIINLTEDNMSVVYYYKPTDFVHGPNIQSVTSAIVRLEGNRILSDTAGLKIGYTYRNETPTTYNGQFITAFATKIASTICFEITNSTSKAEKLLEKYESVDLPRAIAADSQQGTPLGMQQDEWEKARLFSGVATTGETWHPAD